MLRCRQGGQGGAQRRLGVEDLLRRGGGEPDGRCAVLQADLSYLQLLSEGGGGGAGLGGVGCQSCGG